MTLSLRLDLRQSQGLVMTPQLQQAIKLLQLSNLELKTYVEQELEQNPFLEAREGEARAAAERRTEGTELDGSVPLPNGEASGDGWSGGLDDGWSDPARDPPPAGLGIDSLGQVGRGGRIDFDADGDDLGARLARPETLQDHLTEQLMLDVPAGFERLIGLQLIDQVDEAGYLRADLVELADRLGCTSEEIEAVLARLQRFDPTGVCARSVAECLALQLRERDRLDPAMQALIDHLDLLATGDFPALLRVCRVDGEDLAEMIGELKALNPKPGLAFAADSVQTAVPDVFVLPAAGGRWRIELNAATLPRVLVNSAYYTELSRQGGDERVRSYLGERFQSANWLVKALDQRARTLLRVTEAVIQRQLPFLQHGVRKLRPLVLRDIALATGLHESTVSRATSDKIVGTPRGNFPFRTFFSNALPGTGGEEGHAAGAIRQEIRELIEGEAPDRVLADDQIVEILKARGVTIARRTVAKYRESLGIPSSVQRRRAQALRLA
jgi:RNA polymerase sigma-54 factor